MHLKYKISEDQNRKLEKFARSNFAELLVEILSERQKRINEMFRTVVPEVFLQVQGRALEIDDLLTALKIKVQENE
jgi:hypothetical protein